jgi:cold shock CspA family protein
MEANGKMLWFHAEKGFGCICTAEGERLHVAECGFERGQVPQGRCAGREVVFDVVGFGSENQAMNVRFFPEPVARRARVRHANRPR